MFCHPIWLLCKTSIILIIEPGSTCLTQGVMPDTPPIQKSDTAYSVYISNDYWLLTFGINYHKGISFTISEIPGSAFLSLHFKIGEKELAPCSSIFLHTVNHKTRPTFLWHCFWTSLHVKLSETDSMPSLAFQWFSVAFWYISGIRTFTPSRIARYVKRSWSGVWIRPTLYCRISNNASVMLICSMSPVLSI